MKTGSIVFAVLVLLALWIMPSSTVGQVHQSSKCIKAINDCKEYGNAGSGCTGYSTVDCPGNPGEMGDNPCTHCEGTPSEPLNVCTWFDDPNYVYNSKHCALLDQTTPCGQSKPGWCTFVPSNTNPNIGICDCLSSFAEFNGDCSFQNCEGDVP